MAVLIKKENFKKGLPFGFTWNQNKIALTDHSHNLLTDDKDFIGSSNTFEVNSIDDIEEVRNNLLSKPLITLTKCFKSYKEYRGAGVDGSRDVEYFTMTDDFVVILNTANNDVRTSMDKVFDKAKELLNQNAKFVVVFNLDESMKMWYAQVPHENSDPKTAQATGANFYITHNAEPKSKCGRCFECEYPMQKAMWIICFPCCLITGVPYLCYRNCLRNIKDVKISTRIHTQEHSVLQHGTYLASLFQPPQTMVVTTQHYGNQPTMPPTQYPQYAPTPQYPASNQGYPMNYNQYYGNQQPPYPPTNQ